MTASRVRVVLNRYGIGTVEVDGQPMSQAIQSLTIHAKAGEGTTITAVLYGDVEMDLEASELSIVPAEPDDEP